MGVQTGQIHNLDSIMINNLIKCFGAGGPTFANVSTEHSQNFEWNLNEIVIRVSVL